MEQLPEQAAEATVAEGERWPEAVFVVMIPVSQRSDTP